MASSGQTLTDLPAEYTLPMQQPGTLFEIRKDYSTLVNVSASILADEVSPREFHATSNGRQRGSARRIDGAPLGML